MLKKTVFYPIILLLFALPSRAQTFVFSQLTGTPMNTSGWNLLGSAKVTNVTGTGNSELLLCPKTANQAGAAFFGQPFNITACTQWEVDFDFRLFDGDDGEGLAFCFLSAIPTTPANGSNLGVPTNGDGFEVAFDTHNDCGGSSTLMPKVAMRWGNQGYNECDNLITATNAEGFYSYIHSASYVHVQIKYNNGLVGVYLNNGGSPIISGSPTLISTGYIGFTASTGAVYDNESIKNVKILTTMPPSNAGTLASAGYCPNSTVQLGAASTAGDTYSWTPSTGLSSTTISNPTANITNTTGATIYQTYYVHTGTTTSPGCTSVDSITIPIYATALVNFTVPTICLPAGTVTITNNTIINDTTQNLLKYNWTFGDGGTSTQTNPTHTYTNPGTYPVTLVVTTSHGCIDSLSQNTVTNPQPKTTISIPSQFCQDSSFTFNASSNTSVTQWNWSFGDGSSGTGQTPTHAYANNGSYTVKLYTVTADGCSSDTATTNITVNPIPVASFSVSGLDCSNQSLVFTDNSTTAAGTLTSRNWAFGDGTQAATTPVTHNFSASGTYPVTLTEQNSYGCYSTPLVKNIAINSSPVASFTTNAACSSTTVAFTSTVTDSTATTFTYAWNFGDSKTGTTANPSHAYATPGNYTVILAVSTANGCTDTTTQTVNVSSTAQTTINIPSQFCQDSAFIFNGSSSTSVTQWNWIFGDGTTGTTQNPSHAYTAPGTYTVKLYTVTTGGCSSDTATASLTVNPIPVASLSVSGLDCENQSLTFNDNSTASAGTISSRTWLFDDGTQASTKTVNHSFSTSGEHTVTLIVQNSDGCTSPPYSASVTINALPAATFTTSSACASTSVAFQSSVSDSTENVFTYMWNFGDNSTVGSGADPSHNYSGPGSYTVSLAVTSASGCKDTTSQTVNVSSAAQASINIPSQFCEDSSFVFNGSSTTTGATWYWNFGDGTTDSTTQNPTHAYVTTGTFTVKLYTATTGGCSSDTATASITVDPLPVASFTTSGVACINNTITLTGNSAANGGSITSSNWLFDDGTQATGPTTTHTFGSDGQHPVTLTVQNSNGCNSKPVTQNVTINPSPVAAFTTQSMCVGAVGTFIDKSTISDNTESQFTYMWNFGDNSTGTGGDPTHTYGVAGNYPVTLIVTSGSGCVDTITQSVAVSGIPVASFSILNNNFCGNLPLQLQDNSSVSNSSISELKIFWDYPTNNDSTVVNNPAAGADYSNIYPAFGNTSTEQVTVEEVAYSASGCSATQTASTTILASPQLVFSSIPGFCITVNQPVLLNEAKDTTSFSGTGVYSGDGVSNGDYFTPSEAGAGPHTITYTYTLSNGCSDTVTQIANVGPLPVVSAGPTQTVLQGGEVVLQGSASGGDNFTYIWSPAIYLDSSTVLQPLCKPQADTYYTLTATNGEGCSDTAGVLVSILKLPTVPNAFSPNGDGINDTWQIQYLSSYPDCIVQVYNRYGQQVYYSEGYNTPWNGTYNGTPLPIGTYYYIIRTSHLPKPLSGSVTILR